MLRVDKCIIIIVVASALCKRRRSIIVIYNNNCQCHCEYSILSFFLFLLFSFFSPLSHLLSRFFSVETSAIDLNLQHKVENGLIATLLLGI